MQIKSFDVFHLFYSHSQQIQLQSGSKDEYKNIFQDFHEDNSIFQSWQSMQ